MKQKRYTQTVLEKVDEENQITCEDCGNKSKMGHAIVDHDANTVKMVCHDCFNAKYRDGLYPS